MADSFLATRLTEIREARGYNQALLARELGISRAAVSQWEKNKAKPTQNLLTELSRILDVPPSFFHTTSPTRFSFKTPLFFRKRSATNKTQRKMAERRVEWLVHLVASISSRIVLPELKLRYPQQPAVGKTLAEIQGIAVETREALGVGSLPIANLTLLLESVGCIVGRFSIANTLDAFSVWAAIDEEVRPIVLLDLQKDSSSRSRFNAAHELGHLVMHGPLQEIEIEKSLLPTIEKEANQFAAGFLMPEASFRQRVTMHGTDLNGILKLKKEWRVSMQAIIYRMRDLDLIGPEQHKRLMIRMSSQGYRIREPGDEFIPIEEPTLVRKCMDLLASEGGIPLREVLGDLQLNSRDIHELTNIPLESLSSLESQNLRQNLTEPIIHIETLRQMKAVQKNGDAEPQR